MAANAMLLGRGFPLANGAFFSVCRNKKLVTTGRFPVDRPSTSDNTVY
jgi:hypothetical protein